MSIVTTEGITVGSFLAANVGYDQTLIAFYKVERVSEQSVWLTRWSSKVVATQGHENIVVPGDKAAPEFKYVGTGYDAKRVDLVAQRRLVKQHKPGTQQYVSVSDYANAYPIRTGTSMRETHPAFGR